MTLTDAQLQEIENAELVVLIAALGDVKRRGDGAAITKARQKLDDFTSQSTFPDLQQVARDAFNLSIDTSVENFIQRIGEISDALAPAGAVLKSATEIAKSGKKNLLFPRLGRQLHRD